MHHLLRIREEDGRTVSMLQLEPLPPDSFLVRAFKNRFPDHALEVRGRNDEHHKATLVYPVNLTDETLGTFLRDVAIESVRLSMANEHSTPP